VFASTNAKSLVLINKDQSNVQTANVGMTGEASGTADVWSKTNAERSVAAPVHRGSFAFSGGAFTVNLPPDSVTTVVLP